MASIRQFTTEDLISIQNQNLLSLPENYNMKYYYYHLITSPELSFVAVNENNQVVGYVLGKVNEEDKSIGDITSVAVQRNYRRLGIANRLMRQVEKKMMTVYNIKKCRLNVRETNYAARHLYDTLGFKEVDVDVKYYADGENGICMEDDLVKLREELGLPAFKGEEKDQSASEKVKESKSSKSKGKNKKH